MVSLLSNAVVFRSGAVHMKAYDGWQHHWHRFRSGKLVRRQAAFEMNQPMFGTIVGWTTLCVASARVTARSHLM